MNSMNVKKKMIVKEIVSQSKMSPKKKENFISNEIQI